MATTGPDQSTRAVIIVTKVLYIVASYLPNNIRIKHMKVEESDQSESLLLRSTTKYKKAVSVPSRLPHRTNLMTL